MAALDLVVTFRSKRPGAEGSSFWTGLLCSKQCQCNRGRPSHAGMRVDHIAKDAVYFLWEHKDCLEPSVDDFSEMQAPLWHLISDVASKPLTICLHLSMVSQIA